MKKQHNPNTEISNGLKYKSKKITPEESMKLSINALYNSIAS